MTAKKLRCSDMNTIPGVEDKLLYQWAYMGFQGR